MSDGAEGGQGQLLMLREAGDHPEWLLVGRAAAGHQGRRLCWLVGPGPMGCHEVAKRRQWRTGPAAPSVSSSAWTDFLPGQRLTASWRGSDQASRMDPLVHARYTPFYDAPRAFRSAGLNWRRVELLRLGKVSQQRGAASLSDLGYAVFMLLSSELPSPTIHASRPGAVAVPDVRTRCSKLVSQKRCSLVLRGWLFRKDSDSRG
jgi:hypothetical protein